MSDEAQADLVFKALGDARRREILDLLKVRARTTGELVEAFPDIDRCTVMQHIGVLENAGLLIATREGRQRWNHLDVGPIVAIQDRWIAPYARSSVSLLARLKRDLES
jgi:DNA-binding transcriptional ArsR family regulator